MKPFDLEKALAGEPVKLRGGQKAYVKYVLSDEYSTSYPLRGFIEWEKYTDGSIYAVEHSWMLDGNSPSLGTRTTDIIGMWEEPKCFVNGIEVSPPITMKTWVDGESYWYVAFDTSNMAFERCLRYHFEIDKRLIEQGLVFKTKEEAEAMAKALLNYKVEYKDGSCEETNKNNSGWIDINEKLPPFETEVLGRCIVDNEELIIIVSRESQDGEYWFSPVNFSGVCEDETVEVTHWQPLPELPQNQA